MDMQRSTYAEAAMAMAEAEGCPPDCMQALLHIVDCALGLWDGEQCLDFEHLAVAFSASFGGVVERAIDFAYVGDGAQNRDLDLGDDYDLVFIWLEESQDITANHLAWAYAFRECYGWAWQGAAADMRHRAMAAANLGFQGKRAAPNNNQVRLGNRVAPAQQVDCNFLSWNYRLIGIKFRSMA